MKGWLGALKHCCFHPCETVRLGISSLYLGAGIFVNFVMLQVLCMPVWWAAVLFLLSSIAILFFPWAKHRLPAFASFLLGTGVWVYLYVLVFLLFDSDADKFAIFLTHLAIYVITVFFFGAGLLAFIPLYFLYHIYRYYRLANRSMFYAGLTMPMLVLIPYLYLFHYRFKDFNTAATQERISSLPKDHFTERFLGIGLWVSSDTYYPHRFLNREQYYMAMFPDKPVKVWCPCSYSKDGRTYFSK